MKTKLDKTAAYDQLNWEAARIIVADPIRYEGAQLMWAEAFLERMEAEKQEAAGRKAA